MSADHFDLLLTRISSSLADLHPTADEDAGRLKLSMSWIGYGLNISSGNKSDVLLKGAYGCAVESISLLSFGLLRPAILSLRSHYELCLQFLFFKDHPREMQSLLDYRVQGPLPGVVKKYLREHSPCFEARLTKLNKVRRRKMDDVYGMLSSVAHGNALNSISAATLPVDLVESKEAIQQSIEIYEGVGEIVSDFFLSDFGSNWMSVPDNVQSDVIQRLQIANPSIELSM